MATLDPDVSALLAELAAGGLAELARSAAEAATGPDEPDEGDGPAERDGRPRTREEQLDRATKVVVSKLRREMAVTDRLRQLAPELGLVGVSVAGGPAGEGEHRVTPDNLLTLERRTVIEKLLVVWRVAEGELRRSWEGTDGE